MKFHQTEISVIQQHFQLNVRNANEIITFVDKGIGSNDPLVKNSETYKQLENASGIGFPKLYFNIPMLKLVADIICNFSSFKLFNFGQYHLDSDAESVLKALGNSKSIKKISMVTYSKDKSVSDSTVKTNLINVFKESHKSSHKESFFTGFKIFNNDNDFHLPNDVLGLIVGHCEAVYSYDVTFA